MTRRRLFDVFPQFPPALMRSSLRLVAVVCCLAACTSKEGTTSSSTGVNGGTLIITPPNDATDLFPPYVSQTPDRWVQDQVFDR